jgi:LuxR family quorum-sensing system transcriptional regulator SolR
MNNWEADLSAEIYAAKDENALFEKVSIYAKKLGFDFCSYGAKTPFPLTRPNIVILSNYTDAWMEEYANNDYFSVDPTVAHGLKSSSSILWTPESFSKAKDMWENCNAHGMKYGWAQSAWDSTNLFGLLNLSRSAEPLTEKELWHVETRMTWLGQATHTAMSRFLCPKMMPESQVQFTAREKEVLCWTAEGKTAAEIGIILSISIATANFHINNLIQKMGATNKTQAIAKAVMVGLLN